MFWRRLRRTPDRAELANRTAKALKGLRRQRKSIVNHRGADPNDAPNRALESGGGAGATMP